MLDVSMPPIPETILEVQKQYARILEKIRRASGRNDISAPQAVIIMYIGADKLTSGQISAKGYAGTNVSYNLAKLRKMGLVKAKAPAIDKRRMINWLTPEGLELCIRLRRELAVSGLTNNNERHKFYPNRPG